VIVADNVADYCVREVMTQARVDWTPLLSPVAPPFPQFWIEMRRPAGRAVAPLSLAWGCLFRACEGREFAALLRPWIADPQGRSWLKDQLRERVQALEPRYGDSLTEKLERDVPQEQWKRGEELLWALGWDYRDLVEGRDDEYLERVEAREAGYRWLLKVDLYTQGAASPEPLRGPLGSSTLLLTPEGEPGPDDPSLRLKQEAVLRQKETRAGAARLQDEMRTVLCMSLMGRSRSCTAGT
jgi:hypothetical protein